MASSDVAPPAVASREREFDLRDLYAHSPASSLPSLSKYGAVLGPTLAALGFGHTILVATYAPATTLDPTNLADLAVGVFGVVVGWAALRTMRRPIPVRLRVDDTGISVYLSDGTTHALAWSDRGFDIGLAAMSDRSGRPGHVLVTPDLYRSTPGKLVPVPEGAVAVIEETAARKGLRVEPISSRAGAGWTMTAGLRIRSDRSPTK